MENIKEIWRDIEGYPNYMVSNLGKVKSLNFNKTGKEKIMKNCKNKDGYLKIGLWKNGKRKNYLIHRLVAQAFLDNPNNLPEINHKDENPQNNRVENIEYCDRTYNINYGKHNEKIAKTKSIPIIQLTTEGEFIMEWNSATEAGKELNISQSTINEVIRGKRKTAGGYVWMYKNKKVA